MKRAIVIALALTLPGCELGRPVGHDTLHQTLGDLPAFKLNDQNGTRVGREQLLDKVCVVSVFFSCCTTSCPITQTAMAKLQEKFARYPDVLLVSINVYPGHDTPSIVAQFARDRHADPARWLFLHGDKDEIYNLVQKGFYQALEENKSAQPGNEVLHTPNFLVVDHRGTIRGYVDGRQPSEVDRLTRFVKQLVREKTGLDEPIGPRQIFPAVNASLNAFCGLLLVAGFAFIKCRWILAHKVAMLSALGVSAIFLGCYLYYHFAILDGQPTRFAGEGPVRYLYLGILLSHTVLAVAVAPLALRVTYLGLRNRLAGHVRMARWTLPAWLYVSVTGVVVYWMLYHLYPPA